MCDTFELSVEPEITERLVSVIEPQIVDGVAVIGDVKLLAEDGIVPQITKVEAKKHITGEYWVYILDYILPKGKSTFKIKFQM